VDLARRLAVARGDELADAVIQGGKVFSAFTREWLETDVAVCDGFVAGLGEYAGREVIHAAVMLDGKPYGRVSPQVADFLIDDAVRRSGSRS
jgi:hypothetical protein